MAGSLKLSGNLPRTQVIEDTLFTLWVTNERRLRSCYPGIN